MNGNMGRLIIGGRVVVVCLLVTIAFYSGSILAQEPEIPTEQPNAEIGLEIFADRCAGCHGPTGQGDGELAVNLEIPPASFASAEYHNSALPPTMFDTIFHGRFEAQMPPFGPGTENSNPIGESDIWNLIAAVFSLGTPAEQLAEGQEIYEEKCAACHGESGAGDGPDAAELESESLDLTHLSYWFSRSNEMIVTELISSDVPEHTSGLGDDEIWSAIDYARTFSYVYADPLAAAPQIAAARISGEVRNGTTGEIVTDGTARLRGFTTSFEETVNITTTVTDGRYNFELEQVPADWVYLTSIVYGGLSFSSDAGQLSSTEPELDLPVTIFERTTNSESVAIDQIHLILSFGENRVAVDELYVFSNREAAVYVGETGQPQAGTVRLDLPDAAENVGFERTMGSFETTIPADEIIQTAGGWADTLPLRPGQGGLNLLVHYELPYDDGVNLSHQVMYDAANVTVILPDVEVELEEGGWNFLGTQQMTGGGAFMSYDRAGVPAGDRLDLTLSGQPNLSAIGGNPNALASRDQTSELLIGGGVLLIAVAAALFAVRSWRSPDYTDSHHLEYSPSESENDINGLAAAIAHLDDAYDSGELEEEEYLAQRKRLKDELRSLWT